MSGQRALKHHTGRADFLSRFSSGSRYRL